MQAGDWQAAESQLVTAGGLSPGDSHIRVAQGELYAGWAEIEPERYTQAEAEYRRAVEMAPTVARYHTALGLVLIRQGRIEEGLAELERTVELDATDGAAYRHLADVYRMMGRDTESDWARAEVVRWGAD
jgi:predicted Zn-dependent protease